MQQALRGYVWETETGHIGSAAVEVNRTLFFIWLYYLHGLRVHILMSVELDSNLHSVIKLYFD